MSCQLETRESPRGAPVSPDQLDWKNSLRSHGWMSCLHPLYQLNVHLTQKYPQQPGVVVRACSPGIEEAKAGDNVSRLAAV